MLTVSKLNADFKRISIVQVRKKLDDTSAGVPDVRRRTRYDRMFSQELKLPGEWHHSSHKNCITEAKLRYYTPLRLFCRADVFKHNADFRDSRKRLLSTCMAN